MKEWRSVDEILDFAIEREQEAADFYNQLAARMARPNMRDVFIQFAGEEMGHKAKLQLIQRGELAMRPRQEVPDLKIGDYLVAVEPNEAMDYQGALLVAMKKEKAAFKLYTDLAASTTDDQVRELFLTLAQEEAKHKLRFEIEYDEYILTQN
jgi:rubrerythrin